MAASSRAVFEFQIRTLGGQRRGPPIINQVTGTAYHLSGTPLPTYEVDEHVIVPRASEAPIPPDSCVQKQHIEDWKLRMNGAFVREQLREDEHALSVVGEQLARSGLHDSDFLRHQFAPLLQDPTRTMALHEKERLFARELQKYNEMIRIAQTYYDTLDAFLSHVKRFNRALTQCGAGFTSTCLQYAHDDVQRGKQRFEDTNGPDILKQMEICLLLNAMYSIDRERLQAMERSYRDLRSKVDRYGIREKNIDDGNILFLYI